MSTHRLWFRTVLLRWRDSSITLALTTLTVACGTTVIAPQSGYEWCVEVQNPMGSDSNPNELSLAITDPETGMDPRGCSCFTAAEHLILEEGSTAEGSGASLPAGYEALRDELIAAARLRCTELAIENEPPLVYTDCLVAASSVPYSLSDSASCTICIEAEVWGGEAKEVECPPGLEDATAGAADTTPSDATTMGDASADDTSDSGDSMFGLRARG